MSHYDEFKQMFGNRPSQAKLAILRSESKRLLSTIQGYSQLMQKLVSERKPSELPNDLGAWSRKISESVSELDDLIKALTE